MAAVVFIKRTGSLIRKGRIALYNEELKQRFIEQSIELESIRAHFKWYFARTEPFETELGKDICTFSTDEVSKVVQTSTGMRLTSTANYLRFIKRYVTWCIHENVAEANPGILDLNLGCNNSLSLHSIRDPAELQEYLNALFEPEGEMKSSNTLRAFLWLTFAGVEEEDMLKIRSRDVDFRYRILHVREQSYEIYPEAIPAFKNCVSCNEFYRVVWGKDIAHGRCSGDQILRGIKKLPSLTTMQGTINKAAKEARQSGKTQKTLSVSHIRMSGEFYRFYIMEKSGVDLNFRELALPKIKTELKYTENGFSPLLSDTASRLRRDYNLWKQAHELL